MSLGSNTCICMVCNTAILRGTRLLMDDKLPQQYKPRWCKATLSISSELSTRRSKFSIGYHSYRIVSKGSG